MSSWGIVIGACSVDQGYGQACGLDALQGLVAFQPRCGLQFHNSHTPEVTGGARGERPAQKCGLPAREDQDKHGSASLPLLPYRD
jgi:hypothetical protein